MGSDARGRGPRLVSDDFGRILVAGALRIAVTRAESPAPFAVDAVVLEEDTHLLLSAPPDLQASTSSLRTALADAVAAPAVTPGSVVVRPGRPPSLLAVVHDLDRDPSWRDGWIDAAFAEVLRHATRAGMRALAIPLLGTRHGRARPDRVARQLADRLTALSPRSSVRAVWVPCHPDAVAGARAAIEERLRR
ncbi:MAG: hypothetical protein H6983_21380 [Ectothiorhodospiraceae bacterium]|nr:hypothetical protein [Chromatiales bacterium]MCP5156742.1 hypothetical protein [Ectothiorhodospiraceae bacterium]